MPAMRNKATLLGFLLLISKSVLAAPSGAENAPAASQALKDAKQLKLIVDDAPDELKDRLKHTLKDKLKHKLEHATPEQLQKAAETLKAGKETAKAYTEQAVPPSTKHIKVKEKALGKALELLR